MNEKIPKFLFDKLIEQYGQDITNKIIEGYSNDRYTTFRINSLKTTQNEVLDVLSENKFIIESVPWNTYAYILKNKIEKDIKNLNIYKDGYIYLQSLSSMMPVIVLDPREHEHILDMTAAPGSKTTQIAMITENKARITACERNKIRCDRLKFNLNIQGVTCCTVINKDARDLDDLFSFDKILLDSPCSGSGTLNLNEIKNNNIFSKEQLNKLNMLQLSLLRKALKLLKPNHTMVYSTCSILCCENEEIIKQAMKEYDISIVPIDLDENIFPLLPCHEIDDQT